MSGPAIQAQRVHQAAAGLLWIASRSRALPVEIELIFLKEKPLADPFDERLHIRKVFYAYGASTQRIMKQMNRASAQASQEASEEEGTMPFALSLAQMVNWTIAKHFKIWILRQYEMIIRCAESCFRISV